MGGNFFVKKLCYCHLITTRETKCFAGDFMDDQLSFRICVQT